ncbi:TPA: hypothetical protein ACPO1V_001755 [Haemophilus influenzae]|uniref:hypothetical protein n=1 Tax=Haemophilus influenzae TaxID=727 RepID=UPI000D021E66|nr:hypothetical protein [Haemophilus influenzae]PRJ71922.1 hypothetical protein BV115_00593 [Haemophilus influenzae]
MQNLKVYADLIIAAFETKTSVKIPVMKVGELGVVLGYIREYLDQSAVKTAVKVTREKERQPIPVQKEA